MEELTYSVPAVSCEHCQAAITGEVEKVDGVTSVAVDLETKVVSVRGESLDDAGIRAAIDDAGFDVAA